MAPPDASSWTITLPDGAAPASSAAAQDDGGWTITKPAADQESQGTFSTDTPTGVNAQISDYARKVAEINGKIDALAKGGTLPTDGPDKALYDTLKQQRDSFTDRAKALSGRAEKAGAKPLDFAAEVKQARQAIKDRQPGGIEPGTDLYGIQEEKARDQKTVFEERAALEKDLRAKGVQPSKDPRWVALTKELAAASRNVGREAAMLGAGGTAGRGLAGMAESAIKGIPRAVEGAGTLISWLTGKEAQQALKGVREDALQRAAGAAKSEEQGAAAAGQRAEKLGEVRSGLGAKQLAEWEKFYQEAGHSAEEAKARAATHAAQADEAGQAAKALDEKMAAQPGMSKEEFGKQLEQAVRATNEKYSRIRARESGYSKALADAGDELRVDTAPIRDSIDKILETTRNPSRQRLLETLKKQLVTVQGDTAHDGLSIASADDLRKTLNDAIRDRVFDGEPVAKADLVALKTIRKQLVDTATSAWEPYKLALGKFSTLSRPLDFIQKNGLLRKVAITDPEATEANLTRAQIVGKLLTQATREERQAFSRLAAESPELRQSARLYFTEDLFGPEGQRAMKTPAAFRTWLVKNKSALEQLGIYNEFRNMQVARKTAQAAVDKAAGVAKQTAAQAKEAEAYEAEIGEQLKARQAARAKAQGRVEQWRDKHLTDKERRLKVADAYRQFETELTKVPDEEVIRTADSFIAKLRSDGRIDDKTYGDLIEKINTARKAVKDTKELRTRVKNIIGTSILVVGGSYGLYRGYRTVTGN